MPWMKRAAHCSILLPAGISVRSHVQLLINHGADLEANRSILLNAIYWNSHNVLPALLARAAFRECRDARGATILHYIARFGDLATLKMMAKHDLGHIDTKATDSAGLTALDVFNSSDARCRPEEGRERESSRWSFLRQF